MTLLDREYIRDRSAPGGFPSGVKWLLIANVAVFAFMMFLPPAAFGRFVEAFALRWRGSPLGFDVSHGSLWQFVTYQFLHAGLGHILMNMLGLYLMGPAVEWRLGTRRFLAVYLVSGLLGGVGFVLIDRSYIPCLGASGAVLGITGAFAALFPRQPMSILFLPFFTMPAWVFVLGFASMDLFFLITGMGGGIAYSAHLAGVVAGFFAARAIRLREAGRSVLPGVPPVFKRRRRDDAVSAAEVDRILDKVARQGLNSLSSSERRILSRASERARDGGGGR